VPHNIVEGEPGIFPEPITRFMRKIGELFGAKRKPAEEPPDEPPNATGETTADPGDGDTSTGDGQPKP
jgi:hypothetical protein